MTKKKDIVQYGIKKTHDLFGKQSIRTILFKMSVPTVITMLVMGIYLFSDSIIAIKLASRHYVDNPTAALVGSTNFVRLAMNAFNPINSLLLALSLLFGMGVGTRVAINIGSNNIPRAKNTLRVGNMIGIGTMLVMVPILIFVAKPWIRSQYAPSIAEGVAAEGFNYAWIIIIAAPSLVFNQVAASLLRNEGLNKKVAIAMIAPIFLNLSLDVLLMGPGKMGINGGAWASFTSYVVTSFLLAWYIKGSRSEIINFKNMFGFKMRLISILGIILIGAAPFMRNIAQSITQTAQMSVIKDVSGHVYSAQFAGYGAKEINEYLASSMDLHSGQISQVNSAVLELLNPQIPDQAKLIDEIKNNFTSIIPDVQKFIQGLSPVILTALETAISSAIADNYMTLAVSGAFPILMLVFPMLFGFSQAARPIASYNYGAKNMKRVKQVIWYAGLYSFIGGVLGYLFSAVALPGVLLSLLEVTGDSATLARKALLIIMIMLPLYSLAITGMVFFSSTDRVIFSVISSSLRGIIVFFPILYLFQAASIHSSYEYLFWWSMPITTGISSAIIGIMMLSVFKKINNKHTTLDERIDKLHAWARERRIKRKLT